MIFTPELVPMRVAPASTIFPQIFQGAHASGGFDSGAAANSFSN
jgi:hypothetical protein